VSSLGIASPGDLEVVVGTHRGITGEDGVPGAPRNRWLPGPADWTLGRYTLDARWSYFAGPLLLLGLWLFAVGVLHVPATKIPSPGSVVSALRQEISNGQLGTALGVSVKRVVLGLLLGVAVGSLLAMFSGLTKVGERLVDATMHMLRTMPVLALLPVFVVWFGIGEEAKVVVIAWAVAFPIYINLFAGIKSIDPKLIEAGQVLGLSRLGLIRQVILPGALPQFLTGLRLAMGVAWLVLVAAEEINAVSGLGYMISNAENLEQTNIIFAVLIVFSLLGVASDVIVRLIERWALAWRSSYVNR
jgi:sulfonate transport system permease protein